MKGIYCWQQPQRAVQPHFPDQECMAHGRSDFSQVTILVDVKSSLVLFHLIKGEFLSVWNWLGPSKHSVRGQSWNKRKRYREVPKIVKEVNRAEQKRLMLNIFLLSLYRNKLGNSSNREFQ